MINYSLINVAVTSAACGNPTRAGMRREAPATPARPADTGAPGPASRSAGPVGRSCRCGVRPCGERKTRARPSLRPPPGDFVAARCPLLVPGTAPASAPRTGARIPAARGMRGSSASPISMGSLRRSPRAPLFVTARSPRKLSTSIAPPGLAARREAGAGGDTGARSPTQVRRGADPRSYLGLPGRVPARWRPPTPSPPPSRSLPVPPCLKAAP